MSGFSGSCRVHYEESVLPGFKEESAQSELAGGASNSCDYGAYASIGFRKVLACHC